MYNVYDFANKLFDLTLLMAIIGFKFVLNKWIVFYTWAQRSYGRDIKDDLLEIYIDCNLTFAL
jgi:hypothetical protein